MRVYSTNPAAILSRKKRIEAGPLIVDPIRFAWEALHPTKPFPEILGGLPVISPPPAPTRAQQLFNLSAPRFDRLLKRGEQTPRQLVEGLVAMSSPRRPRRNARKQVEKVRRPPTATFDGKPCPACGCIERYASNMNCTACAKRMALKWYHRRKVAAAQPPVAPGGAV